MSLRWQRSGRTSSRPNREPSNPSGPFGKSIWATVPETLKRRGDSGLLRTLEKEKINKGLREHMVEDSGNSRRNTDG